jgi:hypothetical protein
MSEPLLDRSQINPGPQRPCRKRCPKLVKPEVFLLELRTLGDLNVFDVFPFLWKQARMELGLGPQFAFPTATATATGTGKWQAGVVALGVAPRKWGIVGVLLTWQHSIAGDSTRLAQNSLVSQPLVIYNLRSGWYLRSTAGWSFDLAQSQYVIPIGMGAAPEDS